MSIWSYWKGWSPSTKTRHALFSPTWIPHELCASRSRLRYNTYTTVIRIPLLRFVLYRRFCPYSNQAAQGLPLLSVLWIERYTTRCPLPSLRYRSYISTPPEPVHWVDRHETGGAASSAAVLRIWVSVRG